MNTEIPTIIDPVAIGYFSVALGSIIVGISVAILTRYTCLYTHRHTHIYEYLVHDVAVERWVRFWGSRVGDCVIRPVVKIINALDTHEYLVYYLAVERWVRIWGSSAFVFVYVYMYILYIAQIYMYIYIYIYQPAYRHVTVTVNVAVTIL
jgi:hypothetical protein